MKIEEIKIEKLAIHPLNKKFFGNIVIAERTSLKSDIKNNGIKVPLQITPDYKILAGATRYTIAKELGMSELPCQVISGLDTDDKVSAWIIKDNLFRRHLATSDRMLLNAELYHINERGSGSKTINRERNLDGTLKPKSATSALLSKKESYDALQKTAEETGQSRRTIANSVAYEKKLKKNPELKSLPVSDVLSLPTDKLKKEIKEQIKEEQERKPEVVIKSSYNPDSDSLHVFTAKGEGVPQELGNFLISFDENKLVVGVRIRKFKEIAALAK